MSLNLDPASSVPAPAIILPENGVKKTAACTVLFGPQGLGSFIQSYLTTSDHFAFQHTSKAGRLQIEQHCFGEKYFKNKEITAKYIAAKRVFNAEDQAFRPFRNAFEATQYALHSPLTCFGRFVSKINGDSGILAAIGRILKSLFSCVRREAERQNKLKSSFDDAERALSQRSVSYESKKADYITLHKQYIASQKLLKYWKPIHDFFRTEKALENHTIPLEGTDGSITRDNPYYAATVYRTILKNGCLFRGTLERGNDFIAFRVAKPGYDANKIFPENLKETETHLVYTEFSSWSCSKGEYAPQHCGYLIKEDGTRDQWQENRYQKLIGLFNRALQYDKELKLKSKQKKSEAEKDDNAGIKLNKLFAIPEDVSNGKYAVLRLFEGRSGYETMKTLESYTPNDISILNNLMIGEALKEASNDYKIVRGTQSTLLSTSGNGTFRNIIHEYIAIIQMHRSVAPTLVYFANIGDVNLIGAGSRCNLKGSENHADISYVTKHCTVPVDEAGYKKLSNFATALNGYLKRTSQTYGDMGPIPKAIVKLLA